MTLPRQTPAPAKKATGSKKPRSRTIATLSEDLAAVRKERDKMTLQLETARRTFAAIAGLERSASGAAPLIQFSQAVKLAGDAAHSIDVLALLAEIRSTARQEAGVDIARLNVLDSLVADGGVGFYWQQIRGTYLQWFRITPAERSRVGFFSPPNAVRTLLDAVMHQEFGSGQKKTIFLQDCVPLPAAGRKKQLK